jgi:ABC-type dipeptide/oligopeptide/nickel transport system permease component
VRLFLFLVKRLARLVVSLIVVSIITFGLLQLAPGSFADIQSVSRGLTGGLQGQQQAEVLTQFQVRYGDDVPVWQQYWRFMKGAVHADFGPSYKYPQMTVQEIIGKAFPVSAELAILAVALALLISVPLGLLAAVRKNTVWDYGSMLTVTLGHAVPNYLAAICLVLIFAAGLNIFPVAGWGGPSNMVLPVVALAIAPAGILARYVRSSVLETLREEYVSAAGAKGGPPRVVLRRHVLRNSLIPLVTIAGPQLAGLMVGTIFIESIFGIPGLGQYFTQAAQARDMPLLMGSTLFFALVLMLMNLLVDLAYAVLDPRTRADLGLAAQVSADVEDESALLAGLDPVVAGAPTDIGLRAGRRGGGADG